MRLYVIRMAEAVPAGQGAMAYSWPDDGAIAEACAEAAGDEVVSPANFGHGPSSLRGIALRWSGLSRVVGSRGEARHGPSREQPLSWRCPGAGGRRSALISKPSASARNRPVYQNGNRRSDAGSHGASGSAPRAAFRAGAMDAQRASHGRAGLAAW